MLILTACQLVEASVSNVIDSQRSMITKRETMPGQGHLPILHAP